MKLLLIALGLTIIYDIATQHLPAKYLIPLCIFSAVGLTLASGITGLLILVFTLGAMGLTAGMVRLLKIADSISEYFSALVLVRRRK